MAEDGALAIRMATRADLPAILRLTAQDSLSHPAEAAAAPSEAHYRAFDIIDAHPDHELVVGTIGDEVVATLQLSFIPGLGFGGAWRAQVEAVRVASNRRGSGIGSQMMRWVIERARARGCRLIQLTSNLARTDARRFYERLGFEASHIGMKLHLVSTTEGHRPRNAAL